MGKKIILTCDCCGTDIDGKLYFTINREILYDKQIIDPDYLCPKCFRESTIVPLLLDLEEMKEKEVL